MVKKTYSELINCLKIAVNSRQQQQLLKDSLKELKSFYGVELTTAFLRNLIDSDDNRIKTNRIFYLLRSSELKTEKIYKYSRFLDFIKFKVDVVDYSRRKKDNSVFIKNSRVQNVGKEFIKSRKIVLYNILI